jgi:hypothetical protein
MHHLATLLRSNNSHLLLIRLTSAQDIYVRHIFEHGNKKKDRVHSKKIQLCCFQCDQIGRNFACLEFFYQIA